MPRMTGVGVRVVIAALCVFGAAVAGLAAGQPPPDQFVPITSLPQQESLPAAPLLVAAYAFVWVVLLAYVWTIWRRLTRVEREIRQLSSRLAGSPDRR